MVVIVCTIVRITGLSYHKRVDVVWETFWQYVSASIGLTMTSVPAFRGLFISYRVDHRQQEESEFRSLWLLYDKIKQAFRRTLNLQSWRTRIWCSRDNEDAAKLDSCHNIELGKIERGTITGLRTFIHHFQLKPAATPSQVMNSQTEVDLDDYRKTFILPDEAHIRTANNTGQDDIPNSGASGCHDKILVHRESFRNDKTLTHEKYHNLDKMIVQQDNSEYDKIAARTNSDENEKLPARPAKARKALVCQCSRSVNAASNFELNESYSWLRADVDSQKVPKTRAGMVAKMKCGGTILSAGFKIERYQEEK